MCVCFGCVCVCVWGGAAVMLRSDLGGGVSRSLELWGVLSRMVSAQVFGPGLMLSLCLEKLVMSHSGD